MVAWSSSRSSASARVSTPTTSSTSRRTGRRWRVDFLPFGYGGIWAAVPFGIWFFLAVEGVPLAAEEAEDRKGHAASGIITAMRVLLVFAALMLFFAPGAGGADAIRASDNPLSRRSAPSRRHSPTS